MHFPGKKGFTGKHKQNIETNDEKSWDGDWRRSDLIQKFLLIKTWEKDGSQKRVGYNVVQ